MTQVKWDVVGARLFEAGVDRGVLYVDGYDGVPWNGLISVAEAPSGGEVTAYYIDGLKYMNSVSSEEFEATIQAFTYPDEFAECDGSESIGSGLFAMQQRRKSFGLTYRTLVGNDVAGSNYGYKIHLVYGASAAPSTRSNTSVSDALDPQNFSWKITSKAPDAVGIRPSSHFVVESVKTPSDLLSEFEDILYGTDSTPARMPTADELIEMFRDYGLVILDAGRITTESVKDPTYTVTTHTITIPGNTDFIYSIAGNVIPPGAFSPVNDNTMVIANPASGYDSSDAVLEIDAGRVTDPEPTTIYEGGVL